MHTHVKSSTQDEVHLVPPAPVPVQAGPGDDPLGCPALVPGAEVVDVLPLLEDEDGVEVGGLVDVEGYGSTSSIQEEVVPHSYQVLPGQHSVPGQDGQVAKLGGIWYILGCTNKLQVSQNKAISCKLLFLSINKQNKKEYKFKCISFLVPPLFVNTKKQFQNTKE